MAHPTDYTIPLAWALRPARTADQLGLAKGRLSSDIESDISWLRALHSDISEQSLRQLWTEQSHTAWWDHLLRLSTVACNFLHGRPTLLPIARSLVPLGLPPDLLAAFHTEASQVCAPPEHGLIPLSPPIRCADHHCHAAGVLPESVAWLATVHGAAPMPDFRKESDAEWVGDIVLEAMRLRWELAERLILVPSGMWTHPEWTQHYERYHSGSDPIIGAALRAVIADFRSRRTRYADPLADELGVLSSEAEWRLLVAMAATLRKGNTSIDDRERYARYVRARCAFRGAIIPAGGGRGLDHFAGAFARFRRVQIADDAEEPAPTGAAKAFGMWRASVSAKALAATGTTRVDLRVGINSKDADVQTWSQVIASEAPALTLRFVGQLHRSPAERLLQGVKHLSAVRPGSIFAVDVVGPEMSFEPVATMDAWRLLKPFRDAGLRLFVHVGEEYPHVLSGLRRMHFCLDRLAMVKHDRLGHALALTEIPVRQRVPKTTRAIDLAWVAENLPDAISWAQASFATISQSFIDTWRQFENWRIAVRSDDATPLLCPLIPGHDSGVWVEPSIEEKVIVTKAQALLIAMICAREVGIETCPTSNRVVRSYQAGQLPIVRYEGLRCLLGTDEPGFFSTCLALEYADIRAVDSAAAAAALAASESEWA